ncbi:MAG: hypothetical protein FJY79_06975 [Candidatus Aminicenantes bacterium]|nr:hypothetical protein [Candidatus Aminicenantes bacterium]
MTNIWSIVKKEIRSYFSSPVAYVVLFAYVFIFGIFFYTNVMWFNALSMQAAQNPYYQQQLNINLSVIAPLLHNMIIILILVAPLLTMRLLAEEKKNGTEELLYTSPLSVGQIIIGKYIAALFMLTVMLALTALLSTFAFIYGKPEFTPWLTGFLGLFLVGAMFIAIGIFFSSLTDNQIVAAILTLMTLLLFLVLNWASMQGHGAWQSVLNYLTYSQHFNNLVQGIVETKNLVYFASFSFFGLFLTHSVLQSRRWR